VRASPLRWQSSFGGGCAFRCFSLDGGDGLSLSLFLDCSRRSLFEATDLVALRGTSVPTPYLPNGIGKGASGPARSELGMD
jgi:hypothetical protein